MLERDLTRLSSRVREAAIINPNGEVRWAADIALEAINELADTGSLILGLDIWPDEEGATPAFSSLGPIPSDLRTIRTGSRGLPRSSASHGFYRVVRGLLRESLGDLVPVAAGGSALNHVSDPAR